MNTPEDTSSSCLKSLSSELSHPCPCALGKHKWHHPPQSSGYGGSRRNPDSLPSISVKSRNCSSLHPPCSVVGRRRGCPAWAPVLSICGRVDRGPRASECTLCHTHRWPETPVTLSFSQMGRRCALMDGAVHVTGLDSALSMGRHNEGAACLHRSPPAPSQPKILSASCTGEAAAALELKSPPTRPTSVRFSLVERSLLSKLSKVIISFHL